MAQKRYCFPPLLLHLHLVWLFNLIGTVPTWTNVAQWRHSLKEEVGRRWVGRESFLASMPHPKTQGEVVGEGRDGY